MIFAFWAGTGWSSQVNAAIFAGIGIMGVALLTFRGVRWQTAKQLEHDARQRALDRREERERILVQPRLDAAGAFTAAGQMIHNLLEPLANGTSPVKGWDSDAHQLRSDFEDRLDDLQTAYRRVFEHFGWEDDELGSLASEVFAQVTRLRPTIVKVVATLGRMEFVMSSHEHQGEPRDDAARELNTARAELLDALVALSGPKLRFTAAARAAAMQMPD